MSKNKKEIPTLRRQPDGSVKWENPQDWCKDRGYRSEEMAKIEETQKIASEKRQSNHLRLERKESSQLQDFLKKIETIGCCFELEDLVKNGGNTVIADTDGNVVHHANVGFYLFLSTDMEINDQRRKICQVYRKLDNGLWMLENVCVGGVWCETMAIPNCMLGAYRQACGFY